MNGGFSEFSAFGACSSTCGGGEQTRTRTCTNPAPANGGEDCVGDVSQSQACNQQACPGNSNYTTLTYSKLNHYVNFLPKLILKSSKLKYGIYCWRILPGRALAKEQGSLARNIHRCIFLTSQTRWRARFVVGYSPTFPHALELDRVSWLILTYIKAGSCYNSHLTSIDL